jgi:WD40 repeat protein
VAGEQGLFRLLHLANRQAVSFADGQRGDVTAVAFSPDGRLLASAATGDRTLQVWKGHGEAGNQHWQLLDSLATPGFLGDLAFSPDGSRLAGASRDVVKIWEVATGHEVLTLRGAPQRYWDPPFNPRVVFSGDGSQVIASNWNESMSIWHASPRVDPAAVSARQAGRRRAAQERAAPWHLREAQHCLEHQNPAGARFHLRWLDASRLAPPLQRQHQALVSQLDREAHSE